MSVLMSCAEMRHDGAFGLSVGTFFHRYVGDLALRVNPCSDINTQEIRDQRYSSMLGAHLGCLQ